MAYNQLSTFSGQALERWEGPINHVIVGTQPLLSRIQRESVFNPRSFKYYDDKIIMDTQVSFAPNARIVAAEGYLPTSTTPTFVKMTAALKSIKVRNHIDWEARNDGNDTGAFKVSIPDNIVQNMIDSTRHVMEINLWGSPTGTNGVLGRISTGASSTTQTLNFNASSYNGYPGSRWLRRGMRIIIASAVDLAGSSWSTTNDPRIVDTVPTQNTFTVTASHSSTTGDYVVMGEYLTAHTSRADNYNTGLTGLWSHVDSAAPSTYQGVTRTSYPELYGQIVTTGTAGTNAALTEAHIEEALDKASEYSFEAQADPNLILCTPKMKRTIKALADSYRRIWFNNDAPDIGSSRNVKIVGRELVSSPYAHPGCIYLLNTDSFIFTYTTEGGAGDEKFIAFDKEGGIFKRIGSEADQDIYEVLARARCQLICTKPWLNTKIEDITET